MSNAFSDIVSVLKSKKSSESGIHLGIEYDTYVKSESKEYRYFEGHERGHRRHHHKH
ncbi:hypothetical protein ACL02T_09170 [Pseudonocardia sp. RS010]|uniref:hypothetical protein n=1 Tax=Pseudonocardia sp. RS010 TaxID=3385979 RepID=UPI0039A07313